MTNDIITQNIQLIDENIIIDKIETVNINNKIIRVYYIHYNYYTGWCPKCGSHVYTTKEYKTRTVKTFINYDYPVLLKYRQRRLECKECGKTFGENNSIVSKGCNISKYLKLVILKKCAEKASFKTIANQLNVDEMTVINTFMKNIRFKRVELSEILCVDEFSANIDENNPYAFIMGDPVNKKIIDILPSRHIEYLSDYFFKISENERNRVKIVNMDMWEGYRRIFQLYMPHASIAVDPFHYIKHATDSFNKLRIRIEESNDNPKVRSILRSHWKLFNKNEKEIKNKESYNSILKRKIKTRELIEYCLNSDIELEEGWCIIQDIYRFRQNSTYEEAPKRLREIIERIKKSNIKEFESTVKTYSNWFNEICNSFMVIDKTSNKRVSNAFIEGKNRLCKEIKANGCGFRNFNIYRNRILYISSNGRQINKRKK